MGAYIGDFLGFRLGDAYSYNLNITRVSNGDRYTDILTPNFTDSTIVVPGKDGTYYWDTYYEQKQFSIDFAFDELYDDNLRKLRQEFNFKGIKPLVFDEFPYKKYMVKCAQPPELKYICFDKDSGIRLYKGEGTLNLIAYYPYALSIDTYYPISNSSDSEIGYKSIFINDGDLIAPINIIFSKANFINLTQMYIKKDGEKIGEIKFCTNTEKSIQAEDQYILINTKTHLIEGLDNNFEKTGHLYNKYIISGDFFDLPLGDSEIYSNTQIEKAEYNFLFY